MVSENETVTVQKVNGQGVLEHVTIHLRAQDRGPIAAWLLSVADHPWHVESKSVGYRIPGSLWDKPVAGQTVGHWLLAREEDPALGLPEPMTAREIADAQAHAQAPETSATPDPDTDEDEGQADAPDTDEDEGQADAPARKPSRAKAKG